MSSRPWVALVSGTLGADSAPVEDTAWVWSWKSSALLEKAEVARIALSGLNAMSTGWIFGPDENGDPVTGT
jgi:hypothetical protein